jgi:hypothetical protein
MSSDRVVQIVEESGEFRNATSSFAEDADLGAEVLPNLAVLGPQASKKSTLCNAALGTAFAARRPRRLRRATTRGVAAAEAHGHPSVLALHIEGCDALSRGRAGRACQAHCAALATSLADGIVRNFWYHDIGRLDTTGYVLPKTVFAEAVKAATTLISIP